MFVGVWKRAIGIVVMAWAMSGIAYAAPGDIIFSDDFDSGSSCSTLSPNWTTNVATNAGISTQTSSSSPCSMYTRHGAVAVTSTTIDLSGVIGADLTAWVRMGDDSFSENPENGEDLVLEYRNASGNWTELQAFSTAYLSPGQVINVNVALPTGALHASFQMRWSQLNGSGVNFDYWHIDDVVLTETSTVPPPPPTFTLDANSCDDFENGLTNFTASNSTHVGTGSHTFNSASNSLYLRHRAASATSHILDTSSLSSISVWVRRGADSFSENPEGSEHLLIEAFTNTGSWVVLETFSGSGTQGEIFNRTYTPTAAMKHPNFQIRFRLLSGSGSDYDYWHVDDLCLVSQLPDIDVQKSSSVISDPVNGTSNPKAIPGAIVRYAITVTNNGEGSADSNSVNVTDILDDDTIFYAGDLNGSGSPFIFTDGGSPNASGVSLNFVSLGSTADGVTFLDSSNASITPTPDYDTNVAGFELAMTGSMNGSSAGSAPSFTVIFQAKIE